MERGFEQLFILAAVVFLALLDLLARWLRRKSGKDQRAGGPGPDVDDEPVFVEEEDIELFEQRQVEPQLPPMPLPSLRASISPSPPAQRPTRTATAVTLRRHRRAGRWLRHPIDARRGMVLTAILGPCRGLEEPHRNTESAR